MPGKVIGVKLGNGYVGTVSRTADSIIQARLAKDAIYFGEPCVLLSSNEYQSVKEFIADSQTFAATNFAGVAVREVVQANTFDPQSNAGFADATPADVLTRGQVVVKCGRGTPTAGGDVYVRVALNASYATSAIGDFEASADSTNTVKLTNCQWSTGIIDSNNAAELTIMTRNRG